MDHHHEDFENRTDNSTFLEDSDVPNDSIHFRLLTYVFNTILVIALISNFLIMYLIIRTKRLKRRTYIIFIHWLAWETFNFLSIHSIHSMVLDITYMLDQHHKVYCIVSGLRPWCQLICYFLMLILLSDTVIKTKRVSTKFILITLYSVLAVWVIIKSLCCLMNWQLPVIEFGNLFALLVLALNVIIKEVVRCYKKLRRGIKTIVSYRTNVVRIYVYNWLFVAFLIIYSLIAYHPIQFDHRYYHIFVFLSTFYILLYMVLSDKVYRLYLIKLLKCDFKYEENTATVNFDGSHSSTEAANINIPHSAA